MPSPRPPRAERKSRRTSPKAGLARGKVELREILRYWSQAASASKVSQKAIRSVRIASDLGSTGWEYNGLDAPLVSPVAFVPSTEMMLVALARCCMEHFSEWDSDLWQRRREKLKRLHAEALGEERRRAQALEVAHGEAQAEDTRRDLEKARHDENRGMRKAIVAWDRENGRAMSGESAAKMAFEAKLEPVQRRTIRDWILAGRRDDGFTFKPGAPTS